jgi:hypothetical protein
MTLLLSRMSYAFKALFFSFFCVGVLSASASSAVLSFVLPFPTAVSHSVAADNVADNNEIRITFPDVTMMQLQNECIEPYSVGDNSPITDVSVEPSGNGSCLVVTTKPNTQSGFRLFRDKRHAVLHVSQKQQVSALQKEHLLYSQLSLYSA